MSIQVMTLVWRKSRNKRTAMLLLLAIADHAHDDGKGAFPSISTLARKTRQTERNVQLLLNTLQESGELTVLEGQGPHGCNLYHVNLKALDALPDWETLDTGDDDETDTKPSEQEITPPKTFHPEESRAENAPNFRGGMKNSALEVFEISENKTGNDAPTREISPKPLTANLTILEPSVDAAFSKAKIQTEIKALFHVPFDFDWTWFDALFSEIPDEELHLETAQRLFDIGTPHSQFDRIAYNRFLLAAKGRKESAVFSKGRKMPARLPTPKAEATA